MLHNSIVYADRISELKPRFLLHIKGLCWDLRVTFLFKAKLRIELDALMQKPN